MTDMLPGCAQVTLVRYYSQSVSNRIWVFRVVFSRNTFLFCKAKSGLSMSKTAVPSCLCFESTQSYPHNLLRAHRGSRHTGFITGYSTLADVLHRVTSTFPSPLCIHHHQLGNVAMTPPPACQKPLEIWVGTDSLAWGESV
jgi:hypothetical protein